MNIYIPDSKFQFKFKIVKSDFFVKTRILWNCHYWFLLLHANRLAIQEPDFVQIKVSFDSNLCSYLIRAPLSTLDYPVENSELMQNVLLVMKAFSNELEFEISKLCRTEILFLAAVISI